MFSTQGIALWGTLASASFTFASEAYPAFLLNRQAAASSDVCPNTIWVTASQSVPTVYVTDSGSDVYVTTGTVPTVTSTITMCSLSQNPSSSPENQSQLNELTTTIDVYETTTEVFESTIFHTDVMTIESIAFGTVTSVVINDVTTVVEVYPSASSCSSAAVIANADFEDPIGSEWQFGSVGGVSGAESSAYSNTGTNSFMMTFPGPSTFSMHGTISQTVAFCPGQSYSLSAYGTQDPSNPNGLIKTICKADFCMTPQGGVQTCYTATRLSNYSTRGGFDNFNALYDNPGTSNYAVLTISITCQGPGSNRVYIDTVTIS